MKTLIAYYSFTNHTKMVAEEIAIQLKCDIERITVSRNSGSLKAALGAIAKQHWKIQENTYDPADFELVILGSPVWAWNLSPPMRTYLARNKAKFKQVAFFCTEGGSGGERLFKQMALVTGKDPVATMTITEADMKSEVQQSKLKSFVAAISSRAARL